MTGSEFQRDPRSTHRIGKGRGGRGTGLGCRYLGSMRFRVRSLMFVMLLAVAGAGQVAAAPGAFSDPAVFALNAESDLAVFDFESLANGVPLSGATVTPAGATTGVVLPPPVTDALAPTGPALPLRVVEDALNNPASSGTRSLGVTDAKNFNAFTAGTAVDFAFTAPIDAFGLTVVTPEEPGAALFDADLALSVPGDATASLSLSDGVLLGTFGGRDYRSYFLGVVGASSFSNATLEVGGSAPVSGFFFNVDDLTISLPEPTLVSGLLGGMLLLVSLGSRRKG